MDTVSREVESLRALSSAITSSVAKIHPNGKTPQLGSFDDELIDFRLEGSFPLIFDDGTQWVIKFRLLSRTHPEIVPSSLAAEVAAIHWVKSHTTLPVPRIRAVDFDGTQPWNATRRPCIIFDRMPGKFVTDSVWESMRPEQRFLVVAHVARVKVELSMDGFTAIGSLFLPKNNHYKVQRLVSQNVSRYSFLHAKKYTDIFMAPKSPYPTTTEYFIDMANMRLIHEAIQSSTINDRYVEMWVYRSLIPSLVLDEFNRGPFVLGHGYLDRSALLFDDNFELTGVVNWEWSMTEPLQMAAIIPPFLRNLPRSCDTKSELWQQLLGHYINALKTYEKHYRSIRPQKADVPPVIGNLVRNASILQYTAFVAGKSDAEFSNGLWDSLFRPFFGDIDRVSFMNMYGNAPGLVEEFKRTRTFLEHREVRS